MSEFLNYINRLSKYTNFVPRNIVHVVIGNESCDLDSTISSLVWAYFLNKQTKNDAQIFPILNVNSSEFPLQTENCFLLKKFGIDLGQLIYKDSVNLKKLQNETDLRVTLLDHHVLSEENKYLSKSVVEIFDHRPLDSAAEWGNDVKINMKEVGSCATLIAAEIYSRNEQVLCEVSAKLLYNTIIFDTIGLSPDAGKAKDLDLQICQTLEEKFGIIAEHQKLFNELWFAHNDVSHLTSQQLLIKDLKTVSKKILIPGLPMLANKFLKRANVIEDLKLLCKERNALVIVLMGLEAEKSIVYRDLALYSLDDGGKLLNIIQEKLKNCTQLQLEEVDVNVNTVRYFRQDNVQMSRKQIIPIIKESSREYDFN